MIDFGQLHLHLEEGCGARGDGALGSQARATAWQRLDLP